MVTRIRADGHSTQRAVEDPALSYPDFHENQQIFLQIFVVPSAPESHRICWPQ